MYAIQLDNLNGDIDILKSGLSDLGISIYKDLNGPLREMTQLATSMVGELSDTYKEGGMEGMVSAVGDCLSEVVNEIASYAPKVISMGIDLLENFIGGMTKNSGTIADAAAEVLSIFIEGLFTLVPEVITAGIDIITQFVQSITRQLPQLVSKGTQTITNFVNGIIQQLPTIIQTALTLVQTLVSSIGDNAPMLINAAIQLIGNLVLGIVSMLPQLLQMGIQLILSLVQGIISNLPLILQMATQVVTNFVTGISQMLPMIIQGGIQLIVSLLQGIIGNLGNILQAGWELVGALISGLLQAIPEILTASPKLIFAILDTIFSTDWPQVGIDIIKGILNGIISMGASIWETIKSLFSGKEAPDMSAFGTETVTSFASGIETSASTADNAVFNLSTNAFSYMDMTGATTAGVHAGVAFADGLTTSIGGFDTTTFNTNMTAMGNIGATALATGLNTGLAGSDIGTLTIDTTALTQAATTLETDINTTLDNDWNEANINAQAAMQQLTSTVINAAKSAASAVKAAFENMTITIPKPKIPVVSVSENSVSYGNGGSISVPNFSVSWNALGGIFDQPTIFNTSAGMQGVGEAGPEAVLPLDTLWAKMKEILNEAIAASGGTSLIDTFIEKLKGIGTGGGGQPELAGAGGPTIQYNPIYNLYGSAGKEEIAEADRMSQVEFNKLMKQYEKEQQRRKL